MFRKVNKWLFIHFLIECESYGGEVDFGEFLMPNLISNEKYYRKRFLRKMK